MDAQARRLRAELTRAGGGPGKAYPKDLKREVVSYARAELARGHRRRALAGRLGLAATTLACWLDETPGEFRPVEIAKVVPPSAPSQVAHGPVLHTPLGYRVEGLSLADVASILRVLG